MVNGDVDDEEIDPSVVLGDLNDTVVIFGQVINKVTYEKQLSILTGLNDLKQAKSLIEDNVDDRISNVGLTSRSKSMSKRRLKHERRS